MKRHFICCLTLAVNACIAPSSFSKAVSLSSLDVGKMTAGWSVPKAGQCVAGGPLTLHGVAYPDGIGTCPASKFRIQLNASAKSFSAEVGIDDSAHNQGSVEFIVEGDGKMLWRSGVIKGGESPKPVSVNLTSVETLVLRVTDGGDGISDDYADWANAKIELKDDAPLPVALPPNEILSLKTAGFALNFQIGDDRRLYQYPVGIARANGELPRDKEYYPQAGDGYVWEPALQVIHADGNTSAALIYDGMTQVNESPDIQLSRLHLHDPAYPFEVTLCVRAHFREDVIEQWTEIQNHESGVVRLERMASGSLLLPTNVYLTHFPGDWGTEMLNPITERLTPGIKALDSKLGVRADRFQNPNFILSLNETATETNGEVLAGSLAWSGSFQCVFDDNGTGVRALCGINPFMSTYHLKRNETFITPKMIWAWSNHGLGEMSRKLHDWARDFGVRDGHEIRPVLLNNWEATGFDFDFDRITNLFRPAREIGAELFLLDDGWFGNKYPRINDQAGLGDWQPNHKRFPGGLAPLAASAVKEGLRFGIWIEPEMVNPESELFHKHPNWIIRQPHRELDLQRNQLVLDLTRPEVQEFEWNTIKGILSVPGITFAKWDCNRYLTQPGSSYLPADRQSDLWIDYVHALYALMARTAATFPGTELMLCAGGGGRADYGALRYFHELWPSDNTDPVARVLMQWDYSYFFPPQVIVSHVTHSGNCPIHFACSVAMSARFGMDLDLTKLSAQDRATCAGAISAYKSIRDVTLLGDLFRLEDPHDNYRGALDLVTQDKARAVMFVFQLGAGQNRAVHPRGLNPARRYRIHELNPVPGRATMEQEDRTLTGEELMRDGVLPSCSKTAEASVIALDSNAN